MASRKSQAPPWTLSLRVTVYGYEDTARPVTTAEPRAEKERVVYRRGPLTEWYVNAPGGLEHGFALEEPRPRRDGPVVVAMSIGGDLDATASGDSVIFTDRSGATVLRYAGLKAWDADGRAVTSRLETEGREIRLVVAATHARFPVTVDPTFVHEARLLGRADAEPTGEPGAGFGGAVAISGDTVVVSAAGENTPAGWDAGSVDVFVRSGSTWQHQQELLASDAGFDDTFGWSVAISGDTIVVGALLAAIGGQGAQGAAYVFVRTGTVWSQQQKLVASDGGQGDLFGASVSIFGETAVVGAPHYDPGGFQAGSVYVFTRAGTTWTEQQKLVAPDAASFAEFGRAVSLSADTLVVGAPLRDAQGYADLGAAYVFVRSGTMWTHQQMLVTSDAAEYDQAGYSVSISGDTVVVGAWLEGASQTGSAYVFTRSGTAWTQQQKLLASDGAITDRFGVSVSVSGDTVAVGAYQADHGGTYDDGAAYVFVRSGAVWSEQQKITASDAALGDHFGAAVALATDRVVVGAPDGASDAGTAYVFARSGATWTEEDKVLESDTASNDAFGRSVSIDGDTALVGADVDNVPGASYGGSAYVFTRAGASWSEPQKLLAPDAGFVDHFGISVSLSGDTAVVGAPYHDGPGGFTSGAAYVFVRSGTVWTLQQELSASDGAQEDWFGISVAAAGDTVVVGAKGKDVAGASGAGAAYVFVRSGTTWTEQQRLIASDGAASDGFGTSVGLFSDSAVIGAPGDDAPAFNEGSAYVFVRSGTSWMAQQKLVAPGPNTSAQLGTSVSVFGDTVVAGAPQDYVVGMFTGSASVFVRSGTVWSHQQKLLASDAAADDAFGASVSINGERVVVGADENDTAAGSRAGSAYLFSRSGTTWTQTQELFAPGAAANDEFGASVAVSGDTIAVGAVYADSAVGVDGGSVDVFRASADLGVTKTDGQMTAVPGAPLSYTVVVMNLGPSSVVGATLSDSLPAALLGSTWTCSASPGSSCSPSGSGNINDLVGLLDGGAATYVITGTVAAGATGSIGNTATVASPAGTTDPDPSNDSATDVDTLTPETDLAISKTDSADPVSPGDPLTYTLAFINNGPSHATAVTVVDTLPAGVTFVSSVPGPPTCTLAGATLTCSIGGLTAGTSGTVTIDVTVNPGASGMLVNTATVSGSETDPDTRNNTASAATAIGRRDGELAHGTDQVYDLAAQPGPAADEDVFRINQKPYSSYEIVVDGTSGDIGAGTGPSLERIASDGTTVLQSSSAVGTGPSRSLRWSNTTSAEVEGETIRVRSAGCGTDCGPDDVYRIRAYETTHSVPRFNNSGTQITVLILQNPTNDPIAGHIYFRNSSGALVAVEPFSLNPKGTLILNTATVPGANGVSGAMTVAHNGRYADLAGKTVALEPATGFSFDSLLVPRPR